MKQYRISAFQYYVSRPLIVALEQLKTIAIKGFFVIRKKLTGRWYCTGCEMHHPGRVYAFSTNRFESDGHCGLHIDTARIEWYTFRRSGRKMSRQEIEQLQENVAAEETQK